MTQITNLPAAPTSKTTISLKEMAQKYLQAMQHTFDIAAIVVQGTREVNETGYDELVLAARFLPAQDQRKPFADAKPLAERWVLRNLISDAFGTVLPFLEDVRTLCALHEWKKAGSDRSKLDPIFNEQRTEFVRKDTAAKLAQLKEQHGIQNPLHDHLLGIEALARCLIRSGGIVDQDAPPLKVTLVALNLVATPDAERKVQPQLAELKKEFGPGSTVALDKVEYMNVLATIALFIKGTMRQLQDHLSNPK